MNMVTFGEDTMDRGYFVVNTSFDVSQKMVEAVSKLEGVASCWVDDRYSMSIRIGKLFDGKKVAKDVKKYLQSLGGSKSSITIDGVEDDD